MNIALDARPVERPSSRHRGVGLYTRQLCNVLLETNRCRQKPHAFTIMTSQSTDLWRNATVGRVPAIRQPSRLQWILDRWVLPGTLRKDGIHIFHATEFTSIPV